MANKAWNQAWCNEAKAGVNFKSESLWVLADSCSICFLFLEFLPAVLCPWECKCLGFGCLGAAEGLLLAALPWAAAAVFCRWCVALLCFVVCSQGLVPADPDRVALMSSEEEETLAFAPLESWNGLSWKGSESSCIFSSAGWSPGVNWDNEGSHKIYFCFYSSKTNLWDLIRVFVFLSLKTWTNLMVSKEVFSFTFVVFTAIKVDMKQVSMEGTTCALGNWWSFRQEFYFCDVLFIFNKLKETFLLVLLAEGLILKFFLALVCRKLGAYHWKSGQAGPPRTTQGHFVAQNNENRKKVGNNICK